MLYCLPTDTCYSLACATTNIIDYYQLFQLKQRPATKPLSVMVAGYDFLKRNTVLENSQIKFLQEYPKPWTVLTSLKNNASFSLPSVLRPLYPQIAFRVTNLEPQKRLIQKVGPIFLTSANLSGQPEIYHLDEIKTVFKNKLKQIEIYPGVCGGNAPSDIFWFDKGELFYLRKN